MAGLRDLRSSCLGSSLFPPVSGLMAGWAFHYFVEGRSIWRSLFMSIIAMVIVCGSWYLAVTGPRKYSEEDDIDENV